MIDHDDILDDIQYNISMNIARYAKKKGISYEEAASKAFMTIDGVKLQPFNPADFDKFVLGTYAVVEPVSGDKDE